MSCISVRHQKKYLHPQHRHYHLNHHSVSLKGDLESRMEKVEEIVHSRADKPEKRHRITERLYFRRPYEVTVLRQEKKKKNTFI